MDHRNRNLINQKKLIGAPMTLVILALIVISVAAYFTSRHMMVSQMKQDGLNLTRQITRKKQDNDDSIQLVEHLVEEHIRSTNRMVLENVHLISDDYLTRMTELSLMDEITWYSPGGQVLYASRNASRRPVTAGDPLYGFLRSEQLESMEPVRTSAITGKNFQYGAMKQEDGYFVQSGILAENIMDLTQRFGCQSLVTQLARNDNVVEAYMLNHQFNIVASADLTKMGLRREPEEDPEMWAAFQGQAVAMERYDSHAGERVMRFAAPLTVGGENTHVLMMELSMRSVYEHLYQMMLIFAGTASGLLFLFFLLQHRNVVLPVKELDEGIGAIDVEKDVGYRVNLAPTNPFYGLGGTINKILDQTQAYFTRLQEKQSDLEISNRNIAEAYERIRASEEALNEQLEQIQEQQEWIQHQAYHDDLTQLPNRRHFMERLASCLQHGYEGAVILVDTDNFKSINDIKGHIFGDQVLRQLTHELVKVLGSDVFISRFGGDEFLILLDREPDKDKIEGVARDIKERFSRPMVISDQQVNLTLSMGVVCYPLHGAKEEQLIMKADMALHQVKQMGKNNYLFFDEAMTASLAEKAEIETILRESLKNKALSLVYQPQISVSTGMLAGFEALLRLQDKQLSPAVFIPVAEEIGLIQEIGRFVTQGVIQQLHAWQVQGLPLKPVGINFSALQMNDIGYIDFLEQELNLHQLPADLLEIEITESIFMDNKEDTLHFLHRLKKLGVAISIDDFGTGYSSLSYLTLLPVDMVKLDKSLIDRLLDANNQPVIESLVSLVHSLNLEVVAEGVEEEKQFNLLSACGCDYIQGYLFSKPLPPEAVVDHFHRDFRQSLHSDSTL